jgi:hypothetical protein
MTTGLALQMKWKLAQLARRHNVDLTPIAQPETLPECDPRPMIMRGFATVPVIDRQRMRFRKHSLGWFPWRLPEL